VAGTDVVTWPAVRDVVRETGLSQAWISQLIHAGRLHAVRTRLGWLLDPASVAAFEAERAARKATRKR
jgi:hypothetical protein